MGLEIDNFDIKIMNYAINIAQSLENEIPIVAVLTLHNQIIGTAHNIEHRHAEEILINSFFYEKNNHENYKIFITLEPCYRCYELIKQKRITQIIFGAYNQREQYNITKEIDIIGGIEQSRCSELIKNFFRNNRKLHRM